MLNLILVALALNLLLTCWVWWTLYARERLIREQVRLRSGQALPTRIDQRTADAIVIQADGVTVPMQVRVRFVDGQLIPPPAVRPPHSPAGTYYRLTGKNAAGQWMYAPEMPTAAAG